MVISRSAFGSLGLLMALVGATTANLLFGVEGFELLRYVPIVGSFVFLSLIGIGDPQLRLRPVFLDGLVIASGIWAMATATGAPDMLSSAIYGPVVIGSWVALRLMLGTAVRTRRALRHIMYTYFALAVALAGVSVVFGITTRSISAEGNIVGLGQNEVALVLALALPVVLVGLPQRAWVRWVVWMGALLIGIGVLQTLSRSIWLGVSLGLLLAPLAAGIGPIARGFPRRTLTLAAFLLAVVLVVSTTPSFESPYSDWTAGLARNISSGLGDRDLIWAIAGEAIQKRPLFGSGPGTNADILIKSDNLPREWSGNSVHNTYLRYGVEQGLIGMALYAAIALRVLSVARTLAKRPGPVRQEGIALFVMVVTLLTSQMFAAYILGGLSLGGFLMTFIAALVLQTGALSRQLTTPVDRPRLAPT